MRDYGIGVNDIHNNEISSHQA